MRIRSNLRIYSRYIPTSENERTTLDRLFQNTSNIAQVLELRPKVDWNKGSAVNWILDALDLGERPDVFPIYLGDDITDEDAFVAMETR